MHRPIWMPGCQRNCSKNKVLYNCNYNNGKYKLHAERRASKFKQGAGASFGDKHMLATGREGATTQACAKHDQWLFVQPMLPTLVGSPQLHSVTACACICPCCCVSLHRLRQAAERHQARCCCCSMWGGAQPVIFHLDPHIQPSQRRHTCLPVPTRLHTRWCRPCRRRSREHAGAPQQGRQIQAEQPAEACRGRPGGCSCCCSRGA